MPSRELPKVIFRVPVELKTWLRERAAANHRSANGELIAILQSAMATDAKEAA
jgi:plasmid stability protein